MSHVCIYSYTQGIETNMRCTHFTIWETCDTVAEAVTSLSFRWSRLREYWTHGRQQAIIHVPDPPCNKVGGHPSAHACTREVPRVACMHNTRIGSVCAFHMVHETAGTG